MAVLLQGAYSFYREARRAFRRRWQAASDANRDSPLPDPSLSCEASIRGLGQVRATGLGPCFAPSMFAAYYYLAFFLSSSCSTGLGKGVSECCRDSVRLLTSVVQC